MALTPEQKAYYDKLDNLFAMEGWKAVIEEAKSEIYQLQADALDLRSVGVTGMTIGEQQSYLRGKAEQLAYFVRLEEVSDAQRALLIDEEEDADV